MSDSESTFSADSIEAAAAEWLARRDRGLSAAEQTAYARWCREDPRHAAAVRRLEKVWGALDRLAILVALPLAPPNPDLLAPRPRWVRWAWVPLLGAAAAVAFVFFSHPAATPSRPEKLAQSIVRSGPESLTLEDGSVVELNGDAKIDVQFTPGERRVRLVRGEAYFTVAKNPLRPFIVSANQVTVNAVGTAFSVGLSQREIAVLVTEGKVRVDEVPPPAGHKIVPPRELSALTAGQQGVITLAPAADDPAHSEIKVGDLTPAEFDRAMAWSIQRLEFRAPLGDVAAEFNRYNRRKLVVHDAQTAAIMVGGTNFRADNVDGFLRLLDTVFGVSAFPRGEEIILRQTRRP